MLQCYGLRMLQRLDGYLGGYLLFATGGFALYLVVLYNDGHGPIPGELFDPVLVQLGLLLTVVYGLVSLYVIIAAGVNEEYKRHRQNVVLNEMKANSHWLTLIDKQHLMTDEGVSVTSKEYKDIELEKRNLEESMIAMKRMNEAVTISNEQAPLTVLGIPADNTILISMFAALATGISSVVTYMAYNS